MVTCVKRNSVGLTVGLTTQGRCDSDEVIEESGFLLEEGIQGHDAAVCTPQRVEITSRRFSTRSGVWPERSRRGELAASRPTGSTGC